MSFLCPLELLSNPKCPINTLVNRVHKLQKERCRRVKYGPKTDSMKFYDEATKVK